MNGAYGYGVGVLLVIRTWHAVGWCDIRKSPRYRCAADYWFLLAVPRDVAPGHHLSNLKVTKNGSKDQLTWSGISERT